MPKGQLKGILPYPMVVNSLQYLSQVYMMLKWCNGLDMENGLLFPSASGANGSANKSKALFKPFRITSLMFLNQALIHPTLMLQTVATLTAVMLIREVAVSSIV